MNEHDLPSAERELSNVHNPVCSALFGVHSILNLAIDPTTE